MQNVRPQEGGIRLISALMGGGVDAGISPNGKVIVEGIANPRAHWVLYFNDPFYIGMHPFAALGTHYIYSTGNGIYHYVFGELVIVDGHSRARSTHVNFDSVADMVRTFHHEYISGPRDMPRPIGRLPALLDAVFVENEKILGAARTHHYGHPPVETAFDYDAPTLTRYGRLTHDAARCRRGLLPQARPLLRHIRVASKQELKDRIMAAMDDINQHPVVHTWSYKT